MVGHGACVAHRRRGATIEAAREADGPFCVHEDPGLVSQHDLGRCQATNDAVAWVACFAADAVQMPPNDPPNIGTHDIRASSSGKLAAFRAEFSLDIDSRSS